MFTRKDENVGIANINEALLCKIEDEPINQNMGRLQDLHQRGNTTG